MVTKFIADKSDLPNICSPLRCLLGIFEQDELDVDTKLFLRILYFGVQKVAKRWIYIWKWGCE